MMNLSATVYNFFIAAIAAEQSQKISCAWPMVVHGGRSGYDIASINPSERTALSLLSNSKHDYYQFPHLISHAK